ncbi:MAG: glycosyltransferase family 2 protein [Cyanobacteriota bacterium]|nr:glycosyltransferase family 2 protein [Cyanobacteriota bacterium]
MPSSAAAPADAATAHWQVPEHRSLFWQGRSSRCCVVIPVINEGQRIRDFITRLEACAIPAQADILIVDGGSTDGSLAIDWLQSHGIRGLLLKSGPGKLSAQLRVAYAFALRAGYEGIITIDGNNKDDPASIPAFLAALADGVDFAQASRYIPGGQQEHTPLVRHLAIRLIHAPVLSLASGFPWTDTTQGYRAYSARCLLDPRVQIFRELFSGYELLAYLSYRLPRLGFRCIELPTARSYPPGETPTKISAVRGNLNLIKVLLKASAGRYNPSGG